MFGFLRGNKKNSNHQVKQTSPRSENTHGSNHGNEANVSVAKGITVGPIQRFEDDELNMAGPALALAKLLAEVEPPFTVGLRGDWGSGKSSIIQMIKSLFEESNGERPTPASKFREKHAETVHIVEFNPWANSELIRTTDLSHLLIERFIRELHERGMILTDLKDDPAEKILEMVVQIGLAAVLTRIVGDDGGTAKDLEKDKHSPEEKNAVYSDTLRTELFDALENSDNQSKILFLIDDLDRLPPQEAVKILDVITSLLKMPRCLFLIAVDQDVIEDAVTEKLSKKAAQSYFDKVFNVSIRISNTLTHRNLSRLVAKPLGTNSGNSRHIPKMVQKVIEQCAFRNPRTLKRLMWLAHYRQIENAEARIFLDNKDKERSVDPAQVAPIDELCAALGAVEDAYPDFHRLVFPAIPQEGDNQTDLTVNAGALFIHAALRFAANDLTDISEDDDEEGYFLEKYKLADKKDKIEAKAVEIKDSLEKPAFTPAGIDEQEREAVFSQARVDMIRHFRDITDKLLTSLPGKMENSALSALGHSPDEVYASRRSSGWMATYMASSLYEYRRSFGARYSLAQQIYRYMSRDWDFAAIYIDSYGGFLKSYINSFVIYVGAAAIEIYFKAADGETSLNYVESTASSPFEGLLERQGEHQISGKREYAPGFISLSKKQAPIVEDAALVFRFAFDEPLKSNEDFEHQYDYLTDIVTDILTVCVSEIEDRIDE